MLGDGSTIRFAPHFDAAYAVGTVTSKGGVAVLASGNGTVVQSSIVFPGSTSSVRVASADLTGDGVPDLIAGSGPGSAGFVRILDGATGDLLKEINPFGNFLGGIYVAAGDVTGDGVAD